MPKPVSRKVNWPQPETVIDDDTEIQELDQEGVYKYLGVDESDGVQHSKMKEKIRKEYNRRVRLILRTEINGRNKIEAINSLAVPVVQYRFGVIDWKISELKKIDTKTRKLLNMCKMLYPKADVERLYIPRKDGGRGLTDVETTFKKTKIGLDHYLKHKEGQYPKQVLEHERSKAKNSITKNATTTTTTTTTTTNFISIALLSYVQGALQSCKQHY